VYHKDLEYWAAIELLYNWCSFVTTNLQHFDSFLQNLVKLAAYLSSLSGVVQKDLLTKAA
jgi:hypothetical protein